MRFRAIQEHDRRYPIRLMCRALAVSLAGYSVWRARPESVRGAANRALVAKIRVIHRESRETYGSPSSWDVLLKQRYGVGKHRIARLMRAEGIRAKTVKKWRATTQTHHRLLVAANALNRPFTVAQPNQVWTGDITDVWTTEGWLYLAVVIDLYSRRVVGWAMDAQRTTALTVTALEMALRQRPVVAGLLHHSDRGSQYGAVAYQHRLVRCGIRGSMSRPGNCWDNAVVESFFATLKTELMHGRPYYTRQDARTEIFAYLEGFYNRSRRHSTLGYLSPVEFE